MHVTVLQFHRWKEFHPEPKQLKPVVVKNVTCLSHMARVLSSKCPGGLTVDLISKWWCYHHVYSQNIICSLLPGATFTLACARSSKALLLQECVVANVSACCRVSAPQGERWALDCITSKHGKIKSTWRFWLHFYVVAQFAEALWRSLQTRWRQLSHLKNSI